MSFLELQSPAQLSTAPEELARTAAAQTDLALWNRVARSVHESLYSFAASDGNEDAFRRVHGHYVPLMFWIRDKIEQRRESSLSPQRPFIVGLNAPQGAGKSTLGFCLTQMATLLGLRAVSLSIDDFYLTRADQIALAARFPDNTYLQQRGYPGTHDLALGTRTLLQLRDLKESLKLPSYDKSMHEGKGDRKPESAWPVVKGPLDFVLLEGWMLGFSPAAPSELPEHSFHAVNEFLAGYAEWHSFLDAFIWLMPSEIGFVRDWRVEAEERMKSLGKPGMSREEITDYIAKFVPAYETYLPGLERRPPLDSPKLKIEIGRDRLPVRRNAQGTNEA